MRTTMYDRSNTCNGKFSLRLATIFLGLVLLLDSSPGSARAYRCTDADGNVSYSQIPCAADQKSAKVHGVKTASVTDREACTHIRRFAAKSFGQLRSGKESSVLIDEYGGPGYISPITLNIVNFVSGFRFNKDVSALKVGAMAYNKCSNSGFGKLQTSDLPDEILPSYGQAAGMPMPGQFPSQAAPADGEYTFNEAGNSNQQQLCRNYEQHLNKLNQAIRQNYDAGSSQRMRQERQQVEALLQGHCRH